jgi:hypothetical protein
MAHCDDPFCFVCGGYDDYDDYDDLLDIPLDEEPCDDPNCKICYHKGRKYESE